MIADLVRRALPLLGEVAHELDDAGADQLARQLRAVGLERTAYVVLAGERHGATITGLGARELSDVRRMNLSSGCGAAWPMASTESVRLMNRIGDLEASRRRTGPSNAPNLHLARERPLIGSLHECGTGQCSSDDRNRTSRAVDERTRNPPIDMPL